MNAPYANSQPPAVPQGPPPAPPTVPGPISASKQRQKWPGVLGIVMIVFGAVAALGAALQLLNVALLPVMSSIQASTPTPPGAPNVDAYEVPTRFMYETLAFAGGLLLIAAWQILGGVLLLRRRRLARAVCRAWAIARVLTFTGYMVLGGLVQWLTMSHVFEALAAVMSAGGGAGGPPMGTITTVAVVLGGVVGVLFTVVWGWALPTILWFWLRRAKIRAEINAWGSDAQESAA